MRRKKAPAFVPGGTASRSALPPSLAVGRKLLPAFPALPPSLAVGRKLLPAFPALPPSLAVASARVARTPSLSLQVDLALEHADRVAGHHYRLAFTAPTNQ